MSGERFEFTAEIWSRETTGAWHFVSLPEELADRLRAEFGASEKAFGSLAVSATIGETTWSTSLFWDGKLETYVLPVKAQVRRAEQLEHDEVAHVSVIPRS